LKEVNMGRLGRNRSLTRQARSGKLKKKGSSFLSGTTRLLVTRDNKRTEGVDAKEKAIGIISQQ
jgi:hypothetical protein